MTRLLVLLCLWTAVCHAGETVVLEWPDHVTKRELNAYIAASLLNIKQTERRPTLAERLAARPFANAQGRVALDLSAFDAPSAKVLRDAATPAGAGLALTQAAFLPPAEKLYLERRYFMGQVSHLRKSLNMDRDPLWQHVEVKSVITRTRRRIWFHAGEVLASAAAALERGGPITYRPGTWFLVDDLDGERVTETHVLGKRADWEWDFAIYDGNGTVTTQSPTLGEEMRVPTACFKCHRGSGRLPPFADFPGPSAEMNGITPEVEVTLTAAEQKIVRAFSGRKVLEAAVGSGAADGVLSEEGMVGGTTAARAALRARSAQADDVMGDYAGLSALAFRKHMQGPGPHPDWMKKLWARLVKLVPALGS